MGERDVRHVAIEFSAGPLDGWSAGVMTDELVDLPQILRAARGFPDFGPAIGEYHLTSRGPGWWIYYWVEARR